MQIKAIYENEVSKPLKDLSLPERAEVRITIKRSFGELLDELGEPEAKEDVDSVLGVTRRKSYYGQGGAGYVLIKSLFKPLKSLSTEIYSIELATHEKFRALVNIKHTFPKLA